MRYFIVCGERSGDLHASNLYEAISKIDVNADAEAIGGELLESAGTKLIYHYKEMALMGFLEIIQGIPRFLNYLNKTSKHILNSKPDVVILVDYGGFNLRLAKKLKGSGIPVFYYITPKLWAWNTGRAKALKQYVDRLYVILPFEPSFFKQFSLEAYYVGNPVLDAIHNLKLETNFLTKNKINSNKEFIALLPGSRKQEVRQMMKILPDLCRLFPQHTFLVAAVSNLDETLYYPTTQIENVHLIYDNAYQILLHSKAALVTSGTATLETALLGVPQVVVYRTSAVSYFIAKQLVEVDYISLVNLIAEKQVVKELIQSDYTAIQIQENLHPLLSDTKIRQQQISDIQELKGKMGSPGASAKAASLMLNHLRQKSELHSSVGTS